LIASLISKNNNNNNQNGDGDKKSSWSYVGDVRQADSRYERKDDDEYDADAD